MVTCILLNVSKSGYDDRHYMTVCMTIDGITSLQWSELMFMASPNATYEYILHVTSSMDLSCEEIFLGTLNSMHCL